MARLVGHEGLINTPGYERNGYPTDGSATEWINRTGRWSLIDEAKFYPASIAKVEANLAGAHEAVEALRGGGNYSGETVAIASREHDLSSGHTRTAVATWSGICGQVVATIYDMVVEIYHELLFSDLQATLFADICVGGWVALCCERAQPSTRSRASRIGFAMVTRSPSARR